MPDGPQGPPPFWEGLLRHAAVERSRDELVGDLREEFIDIVEPERGRRRARAWYRSQVLRSALHQMGLRTGDAWRRFTERGGDGIMTTLLQDVRFGLRSLRTNPLFSVIVVFTLGLGIGANTTIYSVVDGLVFHPFPFPEPETLVDVGTEYPQLNRPLNFFEHISPAEYLDIRDQTSTLTDVVAWDMGNRQVATETDAINLFTGFWWGDAFPTLRVTPPLGRGFLDEEIRRGDAVAVISNRIWQDHFGADRSVIGSALHINGNPYEIVGVMPEKTLLYGMDLWIPMPVGPEVFARDRRQFQVIGRIAPGATMEAVATELEGLARRTEQEHGREFDEYAGFRLVPMTWTDANVRQFRTGAYVLLAAVVFVLLIVCANVANLLLSRSSMRRREVALRTALGASRTRLLRQLLTESVGMAILGGIVGVAASLFGIRFVGNTLRGVPFLSGDVELNARALLYTGAVALSAGIVFGLAPALQSMTADLRGVLNAEGAANTGSRSRGRLQRWFVGAEVALALVLLVGGGLLVNSMIRLNRADPGFDHAQVLTTRLTLPWEEYQGDEIALFFEDLATRVRGLPGVEGATIGSQFPPITFSRSRVTLRGQEAVDEESLPTAYVTQVGDGYFQVLGIPILAGRVHGSQDTRDTPPVGVVNEAFVARYMGGQDPLGNSIRVGDGPWVEIIGVVSNTRNRGFAEDPQPEVFGSVRQLAGSNNQLFLLARTSSDPHAIVPTLRRVVREMDADQPIYSIRSMEEVFAGTAASQRFAAVSLGAFGIFALILAALGIYSVVAYAVSQRTREIGLRMALGADVRSVRRMVVRQALLPVILGAAVGVPLAWLAGGALSSMLYEVGSSDPVTMSLVVLLFIGVALAASYLPARRASLVDPALTLRDE